MLSFSLAAPEANAAWRQPAATNFISSALLLRFADMVARLSVFAEAGANQSGGVMGMVRRANITQSRAADNVPAKLSIVVGENLRQLRRKHGFSLDQLAQTSGVSRAMLGQIETGKSAPTINLLARIADALKVSVPSLIANPETGGTVIVSRDGATVLTSSAGGFICRALFPLGNPQGIEIYDVTIAPRHSEAIAAHAPGAKKRLVVVSGELEVTIGADFPARLSEGDAILFNADSAHSLRNSGEKEVRHFLSSPVSKTQEPARVGFEASRIGEITWHSRK